MQILCFSFRTLYCAKGNYDFGISRVIKSLEPYNKKVGHLIVLTVTLKDYSLHILKESCLAVIFWKYRAGQEIINTSSLKCQTWKLKFRTKNTFQDSLRLSSSFRDLWSGPVTTADCGCSWVHSAPAENTSRHPECFPLSSSQQSPPHSHVHSESRSSGMWSLASSFSQSDRVVRTLKEDVSAKNHPVWSNMSTTYYKKQGHLYVIVVLYYTLCYITISHLIFI